MDHRKFANLLTAAYLNDPCGALPNALWKTRLRINEYEISFNHQEQQTTHLKMWKEDQLLLCWHDQSINHITGPQLADLNFALLHENHTHNLDTSDFQVEKYFRLAHSMREINNEISSNHLLFEIIEPTHEIEKVAEILSRCYPGSKFTNEIIEPWLSHPVYHPELWVWAVESTSRQIAALGIAEYDPEIQEGSLEWIQVLPEYRSQGIGKLLVHELLKRLKTIGATFTTVSGREGEQNTMAKKLYQACGFKGDDIWWVLRK